MGLQRLGSVAAAGVQQALDAGVGGVATTAGAAAGGLVGNGSAADVTSAGGSATTGEAVAKAPGVLASESAGLEMPGGQEVPLNPFWSPARRAFERLHYDENVAASRAERSLTESQVSVDVRENVATIISSLGLAVYDMLGSLEGCHFHVLNLPCS